MPGAEESIPTPLDFIGESAVAAEHFRRNELDDALRVCRRVQAREPENAAADFLIGGIALRQGNLEDALIHLRSAAAQLPGSPEIAGALMLVCDSAGESDEADEWQRRFDMLRSQTPEYSRAQTLREAADASAADGKLEAAEKGCQQALDCQSAYVEAWNNLGNLRFAVGDSKQAKSCFQSAPLFNPAVADIYVNLANALSQTDETEQAIAHYHQALRIAPNHTAARINLGKALAESGDNSAATNCYEEVLASEPDNSLALNNLASLQLEEGDFENAMNGFARVMALNPNDGLRMRMAIALPKIMPGGGQLSVLRTKWETGLAVLEDKALSIPRPWSDVGITNFGSGYHGRDEREVQERIARIYRKASPKLGQVAPHCNGRMRRP